MVKRDDGLDLAPAKGDHHSPVVSHRGFVPVTLGRFEAAPFDGEPVGVVPQGPGEIKVRLV